MLYNIFIQPLVIILRSIYLCINYFAGDLGISLMILSVVMNILLRPFTLWASKIQDSEREIQNILTPQINMIKQNFHGAEQYEKLRRLYKRYSYNPVYAIRSGLDLFVQLLPLMAAYIMLSELEILKGVSFFAIKDLSRPDALLAGINLLPFVMTTFNVLATITARKFTKRERVQAFIIAALFLVMLYNAPSALLIYWTTNNFIMLLKNIDISGIISGEKISGFMNYRFEAIGWKKICLNSFIFLSSMILAVSFLVYVYISYAHKDYLHLNSMETLHGIYLFTFMVIAAFVWEKFTRFLAGGFHIKEFIIKTCLLILYTAVILLYMKFIMFPVNLFSRRHAVVFLSLLLGCFLLSFLLPIDGNKILHTASRLSNNRRNSLFFSSVMFVIIFTCIFYPSLLYMTDPAFFLDSFIDTVSRVSVYGMTLLFALILIWPLIPELVQNILSLIAAFLVCTAFINSFVLTESYGNLNALQINDKMMTMGRALTKDIISIAITSIILFICIWRKYIRHLIAAFILISFAMFGASIYCYLNINHSNSQITENKSEFPQYHNRLWRFSKTGQNVICIFLDAFTGDHVIKIFEEEPELAKYFDGFIYFPDTLSVGSETFYSVPSMYGGPDYRADIINKTRPDITITEKLGEAFSLLPNIFANKGYDVVMMSPPYLSASNHYYTSKISQPESVMTLYGEWRNDYVPHWLKWAEQNNIPIATKDSGDISKFLLILSLFRTIPFSTRSALYDNGNWVWEVSNQVLKMTLSNSFLPNVATLQFMGDFIRADNGKPAFKILYNNLPHPAWFMQRDSLQPVLDPYPQTERSLTLVDGLFPEHLYTEIHIMRFLADFLAKLKQLDIYNNTRIIIISDHDGGADSWQMNHNNIGKEIHNSNPNALLMFKDFGSRGNLITSNALMSNSDMVSFLIDGIDKIPGIYTLNELKSISKSDRIRTICGVVIERPSEKIYSLDGGVFQVKGSMFKPENWTRIQ